ncbi:hypothetical protein [Saccharopolyspora taberi]
MDGPAAVVTDADIRDMQIGDRYEVFIGQRLALTSGSVREEILEWVRDRYVAVHNYTRLMETLCDRRLVVIHGLPGTGRATTALRLLDEVASGKVFRLDLGKDLKSLSERDFDQDTGYVVELPLPAERTLTEANLDKLRDNLVKRSAFCVLISQGKRLRPDDLGGYAHACEAPDADELLARHISREVRPDDEDGLEDRLLELAAGARVRDALGPAPRPAEIARMAGLLVQHGRADITLEEVERQGSLFVHHQVAEWFAEVRELRSETDLAEALRLAAFRISLAVFDGTPYHIIAEAGGKLAQHFLKTVNPYRDQRGSLFADDQNNRLPAARARVVGGYAAFGHVRISVHLAEYQDERFPVAVLRYVWENHHNMRDAMVEWLEQLSKDLRASVWIRAAQASGLLLALDFTYAFTKLIDPLIDEPEEGYEERQRMFAAVALDQAARDSRVRAAVEERLRTWRRRGEPSRRWTAAATLGYNLGRRAINTSLEELRILGTPAERRSALDEDDDEHGLANVASYSLSKLFAFGEMRSVLDCLATWIRSERSSLRWLALLTIVHIVALRGYDLRLLTLSASHEHPPLPASRDRWPLLLALREQDEQLTESFADLLRRALRCRGGNWIARELLGRWIRAAERDADCLDALAEFLPHLVSDDGDLRRLLYLLTRMRRDWSDPLPDDVATRLESSLYLAQI